MIPLLKAEDIECRIQQIRGYGNKVTATLLLYKDARCDMKYLDEMFGVQGWKRTHRLIGDRLYCTVSIWNDDIGQWIDKEDVGTESYTEKEKGQASDSFKRACFNIGIGRELYTAPNIRIELDEKEYILKGDKYTSYTRFSVSDIGYDNQRRINNLRIVDAKGFCRFEFKAKIPYISEDALKRLQGLLAQKQRINEDKTREFYEWLKKTYDIRGFKEATESMYTELVDAIIAFDPQAS